MTEKKMTREEALTSVIDYLENGFSHGMGDFDKEVAVLRDMLTSIEKQKARSRSKSLSVES